MRPAIALQRRDVQQRFRRLVRLAHPDQGGAEAGAAERLNELAEARDLLLGALTPDQERVEARP
jgi:DnaJ-class molecular chaperone